MSIHVYPSTTQTVQFTGAAVDAFGRLQVANPYTIFDSQNRYQINSYFDTNTSTGGTVTYLPNESSLALAVTTSSGSEVVRQTYRSFAYQPGKGLLILVTFCMNAGKTNLRQRIGYMSTQNGVYFEQDGTTLNFVVRTYISGAVVENRVAQSSWNTDKFDGTGPSGITLDPSKAQIFWTDIEWLGVGSVRCGFTINGVNYICHQFNNANVNSAVYMTTAILPIRYEITNTGATASASTLKQICCTVISEGGYEKKTMPSVARRTTSLIGIGTTFVPLVSIRLASGRTGAVVIPDGHSLLPLTSGDYEMGMFKNPTLTSASFGATTSTNVEYDVTATAMTGGTQMTSEFFSATNQSASATGVSADYNFDLQLGSTIAGVSDIYTLAIRSLAGSNTVIGSLSFYDLT